MTLHHSSLRLGDIVAISAFRPKKASRYALEFDPDTPLELSVNSQKPQGQLSIIPEDLVDHSIFVSLPDLDSVLPILTRQQCMRLADGQSLAVAGLILHVGREEREKARGGFAHYRWVLIDDAVSGEALACKVYSGSYLQQVSESTRVL